MRHHIFFQCRTYTKIDLKRSVHVHTELCTLSYCVNHGENISFHTTVISKKNLNALWISTNASIMSRSQRKTLKLDINIVDSVNIRHNIS